MRGPACRPGPQLPAPNGIHTAPHPRLARLAGPTLRPALGAASKRTWLAPPAVGAGEGAEGGGEEGKKKKKKKRRRELELEEDDYALLEENTVGGGGFCFLGHFL